MGGQLRHLKLLSSSLSLLAGTSGTAIGLDTLPEPLQVERLICILDLSLFSFSFFAAISLP